MQFGENRKAHVPLRHGQIIKLVCLKLLRQLRVRRLFVLVLRGMRVLIIFPPGARRNP